MSRASVAVATLLLQSVYLASRVRGVCCGLPWNFSSLIFFILIHALTIVCQLKLMIAALLLLPLLSLSLLLLPLRCCCCR
jgi:hypothetical protein